MSVMAYMNEQSEDHKYVCNSYSFGADICIEYFLNRSQICSVTEVKYSIQIAPFLNVHRVITVQQTQWRVSVSWLGFL